MNPAVVTLKGITLLSGCAAAFGCSARCGRQAPASRQIVIASVAACAYAISWPRADNFTIVERRSSGRICQWGQQAGMLGVSVAAPQQRQRRMDVTFQGMVIPPSKGHTGGSPLASAGKTQCAMIIAPARV